MPIVDRVDLGRVGVVNDAAQNDAPLNGWTIANNIRFRDGYAERIGGEQQIFTTTSVVPYFIAPFQTTTTSYWIHAGLTSVYADDGTTRTNITGTALTGTAGDRFTGGVLNGVFVLNNGVDVPQYWGGTSTLAALPGWDATWRAVSVRPFKNFLVALGITKGSTKYPHMVKVSSAASTGAVPSSWDATNPALDTLERDLSETTDVLVDALPMGDLLIIYKERSMYSMQFIGGNTKFKTQRLPGNVGMLARGCAAITPVGHVVLTSDDVVLHAGQGAKSIINGRMRRWLFSQIDATNYKRCFLTTNERRNEVLVCFPTQGQQYCTKALTWNWVDDTIGVRDLGSVTHGASGKLPASVIDGSWAADTAPWNTDFTAWTEDGLSSAESRLVLAQTTKLMLVDSGSGFGGANIPATLVRSGLDFGDGATVKLCRGIRPRIDAAAGTVITVEIGASMDPLSPPSYGPPVPFRVGIDVKADGFASGRYLAVRYSTNSLAPWRIARDAFDVTPMGAY